MIAVANEHLTDADKHFGYELGCDGVVSTKKAMELLDCSRATVWRLWQDGKIRKTGKGNRVKFCRRSLLNYLKPGEQ